MNPETPEALRVALIVIGALDDMGVRYHLGGSYASSIHGIPRQTQDIDLVVDLAPDTAVELAARLSADFYVNADTAREAAHRKTSFNLVHLGSGIKVDVFILGRTPFDLEEFRRPRPERIAIDPEAIVYVKSPEDTILRKLLWYRMGGEASDRQWTDVLGIARTQGDRLDREYLSRWALQLGIDDLLKRLDQR